MTSTSTISFFSLHHQPIYVPVVTLSRPSRRPCALRLLVAHQESPGQVCGVAWLVGHTPPTYDHLAIYRLKVQKAKSSTRRTLPALFVLEDQYFKDYTHWQLQQAEKQHHQEQNRNPTPFPQKEALESDSVLPLTPTRGIATAG